MLAEFLMRGAIWVDVCEVSRHNSNPVEAEYRMQHKWSWASEWNLSESSAK